jgi:hypothetical protein
LPEDVETTDDTRELTLPDNIEFQDRSWKIQRIGWVGVALILLAALVGLAGEGPLSRATAGNEATGFQVEYSRFVRHGAPVQLKVLVAEEAAAVDEVRIALDREYVNGLNLDSIVPEPDRVEAMPDWFVYVFQVHPGTRPITVTFNLTHQGVGLRSVRVALGDSEPVAFDQFVYP